MGTHNIQYSFDEMQESSLRICEQVKIVLCPMCEDWHENNTNCQRND